MTISSLFRRFVSSKLGHSIETRFLESRLAIDLLGPRDSQIIEFLFDYCALTSRQLITWPIDHAFDGRKLINDDQISVISIIIDSIEVLLQLEVIEMRITRVVR